MAGYWIRINQTIQDDSRLWELQDALRLQKRRDVIGMLASLWFWGMAHECGDHLENVKPVALAKVAEWDGDVIEFYQALTSTGWIIDKGDGTLAFADWDEINQLKLKKERNAAYYEQVRRIKKNSALKSSESELNDSESVLKSFDSDEISTIEERREEKRREEEKKDKDKAKVPQKAEPAPVPFSEIMEKFNEICTSLPKVQKLTEARKRAIRRRWEEDAKKDISWFVRLFDKVRESDFLSGRNGRSWRADFDWILELRNVTRILEGNYDQDRQEQQPTPAPATWTTAATPNGNADHNSDQAEQDEIRRLLARNKRYEFLAKAGGVQL